MTLLLSRSNKTEENKEESPEHESPQALRKARDTAQGC